jgi:hypothetical protein
MAYQPGLMARMSALSLLMYWGMVIVTLHRAGGRLIASAARTQFHFKHALDNFAPPMVKQNGSSNRVS